MRKLCHSSGARGQTAAQGSTGTLKKLCICRQVRGQGTRVLETWLLLLAVVIAHHWLGPGPAARPPPAPLQPILGLLLPAKLDLHFD